MRSWYWRLMSWRCDVVGHRWELCLTSDGAECRRCGQYMPHLEITRRGITL